MTIKLLTEHHLEFQSLEAAQARLSLHLSKCHIVGNHMSQLNNKDATNTFFNLVLLFHRTYHRLGIFRGHEFFHELFGISVAV